MSNEYSDPRKMNKDLLSDEEQKKMLIAELKKGEESGLVENFDREEFLKELNRKYSSDFADSSNSEPSTANPER